MMQISDHAKRVVRYYSRTESKIGYSFLLGGTKHFGLYRAGDNPFAFSAAMRRMEDLLIQKLDLHPHAKVLDAGCGVGDVASRVASSGLEVAGIDLLDFNLSEANRRAAQRGLSEHVSFTQMDYSDLEFPQETFNGVYTMETLVHAADASRVLGEFKRVLKPGGRLVMFEYSRDPDEAMAPRSRRIFREINTYAAMPSFQTFTHGTLEHLVSEAGFKNVKSVDITSQMLPMVRIFYWLGLVPYSIGRLIRRPEKVPNAMSGVELWRYRRHWRYIVVSAEA